MADDDGAICFSITHEGAKGKPAKTFTLRPGSDSAVRIGRAPVNDVIVEHRGASQYHAELRLLPSSNGNGGFALHVRDLSMNGTGLKRAEGQQAQCIAKNSNEPLPDGATLLVPMMLKAALSPNDRAWLKVQLLEGPPLASEPRPSQGTARATAAQEAASPDATPAPPAANGRDDNGSASEQDEDKAAEKNRMQFVELLLKTREVSASTTYEEARTMLSGNAAWHAVDERTRHECFEIFVEHLGNHHSKKKKKEKGSKGEKKKEKRRHREGEEAAAPQKEAAAEAQKSKKRKGGSASPDRDKSKRKRDKKGRDKSRSRSGSRQKKRRRGRSGSA